MSIAEIQNTLNKLAWGTDQRDARLIAECYAEDLRWARTDADGEEDLVLDGRDALVERLESVWDKTPPANSKHLITNALVDWLGPEEAEVKSYKTVVKIVEGKPVVVNSGWYLDIFVRDGEEWRIRARTLYTDGKL